MREEERNFRKKSIEKIECISDEGGGEERKMWRQRSQGRERENQSFVQKFIPFLPL